MARVLLLLPTTTYRAHDFLEAARRMKIEAVVGSDRRQALAGLQPARHLTLSLRDPERAADAIARFAEEHPLDAIVPTDDESAVVAAAASERLGLPHNPVGAAQAARRKDELRRLLHAAGVRTPRHRVVSIADDPAAIAATLEREASAFPVVLKPVFLSASRGVIRADDPAELAAAFRRIAALLADPEIARRGGEAARLIQIEEFIPGAEVALEGLLAAGRLQVLAIFDKPDPLEGPYFEETIYVTPSRHPAATQRAIADLTAAAAAAIGLREGPVHAELRLDQAGPCMIELAARSIGGLCSRMLRFGAGRSLEELILLHATGGDAARHHRERRPAGVMMIPIPRAGTLRAIRGLAEARRVPGIDDITISATIGKPIVPLPEGASYLGFIFAHGLTPGRVEAALRAAHDHLTISIE